jgi:peptide deformylase
MIVPIRLYGDQCLQEEAFDVEEDDNIQDLVFDLFETLYVSGSGVGLAATQIGVPLRVFVAKHDDFKSEFINPVILSTGDEKSTLEEGCLSIPNVGVNVERHESIRVQYSVLDDDGNLIQKVEEFDGYVARIIQHEIDHLDGICITDKVKGLSKRLLQPKLKTILSGKKQYRYPTLHRSHPKYKEISEEIENRYIEDEYTETN